MVDIVLKGQVVFLITLPVSNRFPSSAQILAPYTCYYPIMEPIANSPLYLVQAAPRHFSATSQELSNSLSVSLGLQFMLEQQEGA